MEIQNFEVSRHWWQVARNLLNWEAFFPEKTGLIINVNERMATPVLEWAMKALAEFEVRKPLKEQGDFFLYPNGVQVINTHFNPDSGRWTVENSHILGAGHSGEYLYLLRDDYRNGRPNALYPREAGTFSVMYRAPDKSHTEVARFRWE